MEHTKKRVKEVLEHYFKCNIYQDAIVQWQFNKKKMVTKIYWNSMWIHNPSWHGTIESNYIFVSVEHVLQLKNAMCPMGFDPGIFRIVSHGSTNQAKGDLH